MNLALFDLDNTLIACDSDFEWGVFLCEKGVVDPVLQREKNEGYLRDYENGVLDITEFLKFQLFPLTQHPRAQLEEWHKEFFKEKIQPRIFKEGQDLIESHQKEGDVLVLVSATNSFVVAPIARYLGIPYVASTVAKQDENGNFTGEVEGVAAFQSGKIKRVESWMQSQGFFWRFFEKTFFYSDSFNDLPLLKRVSNPCAVNPDERLKSWAEQNAWRVLDFRQKIHGEP